MMKQILTIIVIFLASTGVWAADLPLAVNNHMGDRESIMSPDEGFGLVYVVRDIGIHPHLRFDVYMDEKYGKDRLGSTIGGQHIYFQVPPGQHIIISVGNNTETIRVDINAGDIVYIKQSVKLESLVGSNQDYLELLDPRAGEYIVNRTIKGWMDHK